MNNLNSVLVEGNLTREPAFTESPRGKSVCTFSIATNRYYKQDEEFQNEVSYFDVETWSKLADACRDHLAKGRGVRVVGRLKQDRWTDQEGKNRSRIKIVAEHVEFKPFKKEDSVSAGEAETEQYSEEGIEEGAEAVEA